MPRTPTPRRRGAPWSVAVLIVAALAAAACSSGSPGPSPSPSSDPVKEAKDRVHEAKKGVADAQSALDAASAGFCDSARTYIEAIDRYGKAFDKRETTVGDIQTLGADLAAPQGAVQSSAQAVLDARDALDAANRELVDANQALAEAKAAAKGKTKKPTPSPPATTAPSPLPTASIERVQQAEQDFSDASKSITPQTALRDASATFNSAALSLQMAWLNLFSDAGCMTDEQSAKAVETVRAFTTRLQQDLQAAGYDPGKVDGVYGPQTVAAVKALQKDAGLPQTGFVDQATAKALDDALHAKSAEAAALAATETTAVQTTLKLAGYWDGPVDGNWTPELTSALKKFQTDLGVEPTGVVDAATIAALEDALGALREQPPPSPPATSAPPATTAATTAATSAPTAS